MGVYLFFFFNDTATTEIYTLSLHDALPILVVVPLWHPPTMVEAVVAGAAAGFPLWHLPAVGVMAEELPLRHSRVRSGEHTSELQSRQNLVCRLLLVKKKQHSTLLDKFAA